MKKVSLLLLLVFSFICGFAQWEHSVKFSEDEFGSDDKAMSIYTSHSKGFLFAVYPDNGFCLSLLDGFIEYIPYTFSNEQFKDACGFSVVGIAYCDMNKEIVWRVTSEEEMFLIVSGDDCETGLFFNDRVSYALKNNKGYIRIATKVHKGVNVDMLDVFIPCFNN